MSASVERLAGTDTREAVSTATVKLAAMSAFVMAGPAWSGVFGSRSALAKGLSISNLPGGWWVVFMAGTALAAAILGWKVKSSSKKHSRIPSGTEALLAVITLAILVLVTGSAALMGFTLLLLPAICGWFFSRTATIAVSACVSNVAPAAIGIVTIGALGGIIFAGPLIAVTTGSKIREGAAWLLVFSIIAALYLLRSWVWLPKDRAHSQTRAEEYGELSMDRGAAFECESVAVWFGSNPVLRGVDLHARRGEVVALVGANGAGKSTLLRVAAGFIECRAGRIGISGHGVTMLRAEERAELGLTFVSGARPIFPDLTVLENLRVSAYLSHLGTKSFAEATEGIFDLVPVLKSRQRDRAGVMSGGEQRLLAVAQTLYRRPVALLADELTLGLATQARIAVLDLLRLLADDGVAVVVVDHDLPSLLPRADRAVLISDGKSKSFDNPMDVLDQRKALLPATFLAQVPT